MLDFNSALEMMAKYGYSSSTSHPYIYEAGESIGLCYLYNDEDYGTLERVKIFETLDDLEEFLKQLDWLKKNGLLYHVRMALDNYEIMNPKTIFLRNEKIMVEGEMYDIENFDLRESQRNQMDDASKVVFEAGDLLLIYDEIKNRQLQYFSSIIRLKNTLREKYFELQKEIDVYNKIKVERNLTLLPDVPDSGGIDEMLEIAIKDRYNLYVSQRPSFEEALQFLKEVWDLNYKLDSNIRYYNAQKEENEIRNELKVVAQKTELMQKLNENLRPVFGVDLVSRFRKINKICKETSTTISDESIKAKLKLIDKKYGVYNKLDFMYTSDYLREAIQNTNYDDLALKYGKGVTFDVANKARTPMHDVAASLSVQYRDKLNVDEQGILVLYNNEKFRKICDAILSVDNFDTVPFKSVMRAVNGIKGLSKLKTECYGAVKTRLEDPINATIKTSLFSKFDFTTFETFVSSLVSALAKLKNVNNKMVLNGDINMYLIVRKEEEVLNRNFLMVTNDLNTLLHEKGNNMIGITLLKEKLPVLYSPYYLDIGDIYSKDASLQMYIKEMINFELLVEKNDVNLNLDENKIDVVKYYSEPSVEGNIYIVKELKAADRTTFCKFAISTKLTQEPVATPVAQAIPEAQVVEQPVVQSVEQPVEQTEQPVQVQVQQPAVSEPVATPVVAAPVEAAPAVAHVVKQPQPEPQPVPQSEPQSVQNLTTSIVAAPIQEPATPVEEEKAAQPVVEENIEPAPTAVENKIEGPKEAESTVEKPNEEEKKEITPVIEEVKPVIEDKKEEAENVESKPDLDQSKEEKSETSVEVKPVTSEETVNNVEKEEDKKKEEIDEQELTNRLDEFLSSVSNISSTIYKDSISKKEPEVKTEDKPKEEPKPVVAKPTAPAAKTVVAKPGTPVVKPTGSVTSKPVATIAKPSEVKQPVSKPGDVKTIITKPVVKAAEPVKKPVQAEAKPSVVKPVVPVKKPVAPAAKTVVAKPGTPVVKPTGSVPSKPVTPVVKPGEQSVKPVAKAGQPASSVKPVVKPGTPAPKPVAPVAKPTVSKPTQPGVVKPVVKPAATSPVDGAKPAVKKVIVAKKIGKPVPQVKKEGE